MDKELLSFMKETNFPAIGFRDISPIEANMSEQCFRDRGIFKNEDLVIKAFAYQIGEALDINDRNKTFEHDDTLFKVFNIFSKAVADFVPSEIIIRGKQTGKIERIKGAALESFMETYLDGLGNDIVVPPIKANETSSIQQFAFNIFYWLKSLLIEKTETEFPASVLRVIAEFVVKTKLTKKCDEDKARQYVKRGIKLKLKVCNLYEVAVQRYLGENTLKATLDSDM